MISLNERYAAWASSLDGKSIPPEVISAAKLRILDIIGAASVIRNVGR